MSAQAIAVRACAELAARRAIDAGSPDHAHVTAAARDTLALMLGREPTDLEAHSLMAQALMLAAEQPAAVQADRLQAVADTFAGEPDPAYEFAKALTFAKSRDNARRA